MFHTFYNRIAFSRDMSYHKVMDAKQVVIACATELQKVATEWGIKTGVAFTKAAEKYQADLDQAIKDLKAAKK
jgi:hypothetical protein